MADHGTRHQLSVLRAAIDALQGLGADLPDPGRLRATLQALDPALSGDAFGPPAWVLSTGMPAPRWLAEVTARRERLLLEVDADEPTDDHIAHATAVDPDLAQRLISERTFRRYLRRHETFPPPSARVVDGDDDPWWTWDVVGEDGRWGRLRVRGRRDRAAQPRWFELPFDELAAEMGYDDVRRCVLGPAWRDASGRVVGLLAVREAADEAPVRRLALDRMCAEDVDAGGAVVVPMAVPTDT